MVVRAIHQGVPQLVPNVREDQNYLPCRGDVQSELAFPILIEGKVVAVLNVEHAQLNAFLPEYVHALELLIAQASIAIQKAQHYGELKQTRRKLAAKQALIWMGMASATWRHATHNKATTIRDRVKLAHSDIEREEPREKLHLRLDAIDEVAQKIQALSIPAPLSADAGIQTLIINDFLEERVSQLRRKRSTSETDDSVNFRYIPCSKFSYVVRANPQWLAHAFDLLVDNAAKAMVTSLVKELTVKTELVEGGIKISFADTGKGISVKTQRFLLQEPIPRELQPNGTGMGLLLAQTIVQAYGGNIRLESTGSTGTTIAIWFPLSIQESEMRTVLVSGSIMLIGSSMREIEGDALLHEVLAPFGGIRVVSQEEALEQLSQSDQEVILLDSLSIDDPAVLIQQIRSRQPNIKVLIMTTAPEWKVAREFLRLGATDYIDKSLSREDLSAAFARILASPSETASQATIRHTLH